MVDFLKANPYVTRDEYLWKWTIPQIRLASYDFTHIDYEFEEDEEAQKNKRNKNVKVMNTAEDVLNDLGIPMFNMKNK